MISIVIADDHKLFAQGVAALLHQNEALRVVAIAQTMAEAIVAAGEHEPAVMLLDIGLPDGNGIDAIEPIAEASPRTKILLLSMRHATNYIRDALRRGAAGYLSKNIDASELVVAIVSATQGKRAFFGEAAEALAAAFLEHAPQARKDADASAEGALTKREWEIADLVSQGFGNKEIAEQLYIRLCTVETHLRNIARKIGGKNRVDVARYAQGNGKPASRS